MKSQNVARGALGAQVAALVALLVADVDPKIIAVLAALVGLIQSRLPTVEKTNAAKVATDAAKSAFIIGAVLLVQSCGTLPAYCKAELLNGEASPVTTCRPSTHSIEVDCWEGGGGEVRHVGEGEVYLRARFKTGSPLQGIPGAKCPEPTP